MCTDGERPLQIHTHTPVCKCWTCCPSPPRASTLSLFGAQGVHQPLKASCQSWLGLPPAPYPVGANTATVWSTRHTARPQGRDTRPAGREPEGMATPVSSQILGFSIWVCSAASWPLQSETGHHPAEMGVDGGIQCPPAQGLGYPLRAVSSHGGQAALVLSFPRESHLRLHYPHVHQY